VEIEFCDFLEKKKVSGFLICIQCSSSMWKWWHCREAWTKRRRL